MKTGSPRSLVEVISSTPRVFLSGWRKARFAGNSGTIPKQRNAAATTQEQPNVKIVSTRVLSVRSAAGAFAVLLLASVAGASAGDAVAPDRFIAGITEKLRAYQEQTRAGSKPSTDLGRAMIVDEVVVHFDFQALAAAAMGAFWLELSDGERRCIATAIRERVISRYAEYLVEFDYAGLQSTTTDPMRQGFLVTVSQLFKTANPQPLSVRYELDPRGETWKVTDVSVDGVSLAASYRESFYEQIELDGIGDFLRTFPACRDR